MWLKLSLTLKFKKLWNDLNNFGYRFLDFFVFWLLYHILEKICWVIVSDSWNYFSGEAVVSPLGTSFVSSSGTGTGSSGFGSTATRAVSASDFGSTLYSWDTLVGSSWGSAGSLSFLVFREMLIVLYRLSLFICSTKFSSLYLHKRLFWFYGKQLYLIFTISSSEITSSSSFCTKFKFTISGVCVRVVLVVGLRLLVNKALFS